MNSCRLGFRLRLSGRFLCWTCLYIDSFYEFIFFVPLFVYKYEVDVVYEAEERVGEERSLSPTSVADTRGMEG